MSCIDLGIQGATYRVPAYESIVNVAEPEGSWFDYQLYVTHGTLYRASVIELMPFAGGSHTPSCWVSLAVPVTTHTSRSPPHPRSARHRLSVRLSRLLQPAREVIRKNGSQSTTLRSQRAARRGPRQAATRRAGLS